jgi:hypothetical protein
MTYLNLETYNRFYDKVDVAGLNAVNIIEYLPRGKENAKTASEIAHRLNASDGQTEVRIRKLISDAIANGELIGSNSRGYFLIITYDELNEYCENLETRINGIRSRINALRLNWHNRTASKVYQQAALNL